MAFVASSSTFSTNPNAAGAAALMENPRNRNANPTSHGLSVATAMAPPMAEPAPESRIVTRDPSPNSTRPANRRPRKTAPENAMNAHAAMAADPSSCTRT